MKKIIYITIGLLLLQACSDKINNDKQTWIYAPDYGGKIFTGLILNLDEKNNSIESLISERRFDTLDLTNNYLHNTNDTIANIIWSNEAIIVAYFDSDTICFHRVMDFGISDSIRFVDRFLTENIIEFEDTTVVFEQEHFEYVVDFDTLSQYKYHEMNFKSFMVSDNINENGFEPGLWDLKKIGYSLILYYEAPSNSFSSVWEIQNIYKDSIVCRLLSIPHKERSVFFRNVYNNDKYKIDYQNITLRKRKPSSESQFDSLKSYISNSHWQVVDVDSTRTYSWGELEFNKDVELYPTTFDSITYSFTEEKEYHFRVDSKVFKGTYKISPDSRYIILDTATTNNDYISIAYSNSDTLILEQLVNIKRDSEIYDEYLLKLTFIK
jgi:hypothetical protein